MFLIKGRRWRAAAEGAEVLPPIATPAWDAERALAALNITEVPFDATNGEMLGYASGRSIAVSPIESASRTRRAFMNWRTSCSATQPRASNTAAS